MIFYIIGLLIGILIMGAGIYYLVIEKQDKEARKIYGITTVAGLIIVIGIICKILLTVL